MMSRRSLATRISAKMCLRKSEIDLTEKRRILGIDPGSRLTGFGVVDFHGDKAHYVASGTVKSIDGGFADRLRQIFESVGGIVDEYRPDIVFRQATRDSGDRRYMESALQ